LFCRGGCELGEGDGGGGRLELGDGDGGGGREEFCCGCDCRIVVTTLGRLELGDGDGGGGRFELGEGDGGGGREELGGGFCRTVDCCCWLCWGGGLFARVMVVTDGRG
jgi:hypothetical protein